MPTDDSVQVLTGFLFFLVRAIPSGRTLLRRIIAYPRFSPDRSIRWHLTGKGFVVPIYKQVVENKNDWHNRLLQISDRRFLGMTTTPFPNVSLTLRCCGNLPRIVIPVTALMNRKTRVTDDERDGRHVPNDSHPMTTVSTVGRLVLHGHPLSLLESSSP